MLAPEPQQQPRPQPRRDDRRSRSSESTRFAKIEPTNRALMPALSPRRPPSSTHDQPRSSVR